MKNSQTLSTRPTFLDEVFVMDLMIDCQINVCTYDKNSDFEGD